MSADAPAVHWLRGAAPYINALRGRAVVVCLNPDAADPERLQSIARDISLLHSLGVGIAISYGVAIDVLDDAGTVTTGSAGAVSSGLNQMGGSDLAPIDEATMAQVISASAKTRLALEAAFSMGHADATARHKRQRVVGGNLVVAKPVGVRDGIDYGHAGHVRRVDSDAIKALLVGEAIVLLPPVAVSGVGDAFVLDAVEVATEVAIALRAAKLVVLTPQAPLLDKNGTRIGQLDLPQAQSLHEAQLQPSSQASVSRGGQRALGAAIRACRGGVARAHLLDWHADGALVSELYTPDGVGTMVNANSYDRIRPATLEDVGALLALLEPLHLSGTLLTRTRESLENDIGCFRVLERDELLVACAAAYAFPENASMELACLAVRPDYNNSGRGATLLAAVEREARNAGMGNLFVFTTQTTHWFRERGFVEAPESSAPRARRAQIQPGRNSRMLVKTLQEG